MITVGVCLSGCGVFDGSEIHEAVLTLLALDQAGAKILCCAPDTAQSRVVDHRTGKPVSEKRNVLTESARIARGKITDLAAVKAAQIDALIFPGGFGAAVNLSNYAEAGADCKVHPEVERLVNEMLLAGKPIGALCIAPAMLARVVGKRAAASLTVGNDPGTAAAINRMGCQHANCPAGGHIVDEQHRIVSTPAYMYGDSGPAVVFQGIQRLVEDVLRLARTPAAR